MEIKLSPSAFVCLLSLLGIGTNFIVLLLLTFSFDDPSTAQSRALQVFEKFQLWYLGFYLIPLGLVSSFVASLFQLSTLSWVFALIPVGWPLVLVVLRIFLA